MSVRDFQKNHLHISGGTESLQGKKEWGPRRGVVIVSRYRKHRTLKYMYICNIK
jgi:hypothetical protein